MSRTCLVMLGCLLPAAVGGCGKTQPAAVQVATAPEEQAVARVAVYQKTGPATFAGSSGIPGAVGAALPQSTTNSPTAGSPNTAAAPAAGSTTTTLAGAPAGAFGASANPGTMPPGAAVSASTTGVPGVPLPAQTPSPTATTPQATATTGTPNSPPVGATASVPGGTSSGAEASPAPTAAPKGPTRAVASGNVPALAAAVNQWRAQGTNLVGVKRNGDKPVQAGYSWMTHLLPYLGHDDLYQKFDFTKGWHEKENIALTCREIPAFLDPKNRNRHMTIVGQKNAIGPAFTHFVGIAGVEDSRNLVAADLPRSDNRAGVFGYNEIARPEQITDGISNTAMLVSAGKIVGAWASGGGATVRGARAPYFDDITGFGFAGDPGAGALVAMADGSVKRVSKEIDPKVFRAMCTIHGAETVDLSAHGNVIRSP